MVRKIEPTIQVHHGREKTDIKSLIDSGATDNVISPQDIIRLRLPVKRLAKPIMSTVANGAEEPITHYTILTVKQGNVSKDLQFLVMKRSGNMILGYPYLREFQPSLDWKNGKILGSRISIHTVGHGRRLDRIAQKIRGIRSLSTPETSKVTTATDMALDSYDPTKVNTEETIPRQYQKYALVFSDKEAQRFPPSRPWDHHIRLRPGAPAIINGKSIPLSAREKEVEKSWLTENLDKGYIEECDGPYGHSTFYVKKKNGELRPVVDYRPLNAHTVPDVTPMPSIPDIHNKMRNKKLFSRFDIRWGYNNIRIVEEDRWKTGFKTSRGLFQSNVMNFGLCNAPSTFCRMGLHLFKPLTDEFPEECDYYMDDFAVFTDDTPEGLLRHREIICRFLQICVDHSLFLRPEKCVFEQTEMDFLGFHVKNGELSIDPAKIAGIAKYDEQLNNVREVRKFLGVVGYQRPFIRDFAKLARPLHDLTKKDSPFVWTNKHTETVQMFKNIVTSEPVLVLPDQDRQFELETDASLAATGAILYQREKHPEDTTDENGIPILKGKRRAVGYHSQAFSPAERNYPIYDREYLGVLRGLRHWRHLLVNTPEDRPVLVITDHANLQYYRDPRKLPARVHSWNAERADYNIKLIYKPGAQNHADGLSRRPDYKAPDIPDVTALNDELFDIDTPERRNSISAVDTDTLDDDQNLEWHVREAQHEFPRLSQWITAHNLEERDGAFWKGTALVVVENNDLKRGVISLFHDNYTAGHPGIAKTATLIAKHYWWPGLKTYVTDYIKGCGTCQMTKVNTNPNKPPLNMITAAPNALPFQTIAMDFIVKLPVSEGYDSILTITDHDCSKAAIFIPCNETIDSIGTAKLYATHVFPHYGIPTKVISDRDTRFTSNFTTELCRILGVKQNISTAYHPQTDGQSERTNQSLEQYLRLFCAQDQSQWSQWLPLAQYTRNSWPSSTTKQSPYDLILGYTPTAHQPIRKPSLPSITERIQSITELRSAAQEAMRKEQDRVTKERHHKPYKVDDQVWLEGTNLKMPYETAKLSPKRYGPFRVAAQISGTSYRLDLPPNWKIHPVFHASLLTPYNETETHGPNFLEPPPDIIDGEPEWEVEKILSERQYRNKRQYLVRWKDYSPAHDSWADDADIHAPELIKQYHQSLSPVSQQSRRTRIRELAMVYINATNTPEEEPSPGPSAITLPTTERPLITRSRASIGHTRPTKVDRDKLTEEQLKTPPKVWSPAKRVTDIEDDLIIALKRPSIPGTRQVTPSSSIRPTPSSILVDLPPLPETPDVDVPDASPLDYDIPDAEPLPSLGLGLYEPTAETPDTPDIDIPDAPELEPRQLPAQTTYSAPPVPAPAPAPAPAPPAPSTVPPVLLPPTYGDDDTSSTVWISKPTEPKTVDILLTDFPVKRWTALRRSVSQICGITHPETSDHGTSQRAPYIPLWTLKCSGSPSINATMTTRSYESSPRPDQPTTSPTSALVSAWTERHKVYPIRPAHCLQCEINGTLTTCSSSYCHISFPTPGYRHSTTCVDETTPTTAPANNARAPSGAWTTNGNDEPPSTEKKAQESSSYADQTPTPSMSSSSTPSSINDSYQTPRGIDSTRHRTSTRTTRSGSRSSRRTPTH
jgi:hypothetical protein